MIITKAEKQRAVEMLKKHCKPGTTVYCVIRSVAKSGMSRCIDFYVIRKNRPLRLTYWIAQAGISHYNTRTEALCVRGCGMDMGLHVVSNLSLTLHGFPQDNRTPKGFRSGYTLEHRWL